jgi:tRNA nucleotidyltransferase (CCA-adding enzyme)
MKILLLGLPEKPNVEEFQSLWKNRSKDNEYHPITLLASLLHTPEDALQLHERLKLSAYERDLTYFISQKKEETRNLDKLMCGFQSCSLFMP